MITPSSRVPDTGDGPTPNGAEADLREAGDELERRIIDGEGARAEEYLGRYPALAEDPEQALDLIYVEYAARRAMGQTPTPEEFFGRFPQWRAQLERQFQLDELLDEAPQGAAAERASTFPPDTSRGGSSDGRFHTLRLLARGGIGQVMRAIDTELNREVAVKELQPELAESDEVRERFLREAEITGKLEHPGIVPVYGLGRDGEGRPFYAMRLVRGQSFEEAVQEFHKRADGIQRLTGVEFQKLLRRFLHVCETVAFAHSRGIIHRDLKPANILLGPFGETLVVDWGLARAIRPEGPQSPATEDSHSDDSLTRPLAHWSNELTLDTGELIGTPAFMSPEQAAGTAREVGPAGDVYSLGATLYMLLTGRAPFVGNEVGKALELVAAGNFPRPRDISRAIPRALEAVCIKAMALRPEDRYRSPRGLADDLEHWLADEPVTAARENLIAKLARWGRRNRARVVAGFIALVVVAGVSMVAAIRINGERLRADLERIEANRRTARLAFDRGSVLTENHEYGAGMLWFARALKHTPSSDADMRRVILTNLDAAQNFLLRRRGAFTHPTGLTAAEFSFDGNQVVTADRNGHVRRWGVESGRLLADSDLGTRIYAARIVRNDTAIVAAGINRAISLRQLTTAAASDTEPIVLAQAEDVACAEFSPDGEMFGVGSRSTSASKARIWRVGDGQLLWQFDHPRTVSQILFQPKTTAVATVCQDGRVRRWDMADGRVLGEIRLESGNVSRIAFTPDGMRMLVGDSEGSISCWLVESRRRLFDLAKHYGAVTALACSTDGRTVAAAWDTGTTRTWDLENHRPIGELLRLDRHTRMLRFRPGTRQMLVAAEPHSAVLWEIPNLSESAPPLSQRQVESVALSPDGTMAITGSRNGTARLRDGTTGSPYGNNLSHKGAVKHVSFRPPDGSVVLTGSYDGTARLWNAQDGKPHGAVLEHRGRPGDRVQVEAAAFSSDGRFALTGDSAGVVRAWDADTGALIRIFAVADKSTAITTSVCFGRGGTRVLAAFSAPDNCIRVWDFSTSELLWTARHRNSVRIVTVSPDDRLVMSGSNDETARFWDLSDGRQLGPELRHRGEVFVAGFSPAGKIAVTGGYDGTVRLWEVPTGRPLGEVMRHEGIVTAATFSADGSRMLTGSADRTARLWDVATCLPLAPPLLHNEAVLSIALQPDGRTAFTGRVWHLPKVLPDDPPHINLWLKLATNRQFGAGDNIEWLEPAALAAAASEFQARTGKSWHDWPD